MASRRGHSNAPVGVGYEERKSVWLYKSIVWKYSSAK